MCQSMSEQRHRSRAPPVNRRLVPMPSRSCYIWSDRDVRDGHPMKRDDAIEKLRQQEAELKQLGVQHLYLFGSTARGEARTDSDVDLFFDYEWGKLSLFDVMEIQEITARILGCKTEAITRASLHPVLRDRIEMS